MNHLDVYYRAFKELRKETADEPSCIRKRSSIAQGNSDADKLEATKYLVNIQIDWITAIEDGLTYVEKAVAEQRQFIRSDGEVVPIEKVKKISKDSVEHLAKHSDMITHLPDDGSDGVIPDKLYMVEKLSDYAVYENRFLYMMLSYLSDFINFRLEKIEALRHTYVGNLHVEREIITKKRKLLFNTTVVESRADNKFPVADENTETLIGRIKDCQSVVNSLLNTDLMTQVAKSPMIKPPIVKTNVLKMNNNFKKALALYDYIASYKDAGYTYEEVHYSFTPFNEQTADEIAEALSLTSFLAYKFGNGIDDVLERRYKEEERRRRQEEAEKLKERVKRLSKRALENNQTLEEYALALEERNRMLERDSEELQTIRQDLDELNRKIDDLNAEKSELNRRIAEGRALIEKKELELAELNQKYIDDIARFKSEFERQRAALAEAHAEEIDGLKVDFANKVAEAVAQYQQKVADMSEQLERTNAEWAQQKGRYESGIASVEAREAALDGEQKKLVDRYESQLRKMEREYTDELTELQKENLYVRTELDGLRVKNGNVKPSTDYTSRERFLELEAEFEAFKQFFKGQWKLTKKAIRREVYKRPPAQTAAESAPDSAEADSYGHAASEEATESAVVNSDAAADSSTVNGSASEAAASEVINSGDAAAESNAAEAEAEYEKGADGDINENITDGTNL